MRQYKIATRKSPLALWQAEYVAAQLKILAPDSHFSLLPMTTSGDKASQTNWALHTGKGLFVKELDEALLSKKADLSVHSLKDLPAVLPQGLQLVAICKREIPFDALVSVRYPSLDALPSGAIVGTASLRRQTQLLAHKPDLIFRTLRGNVQTRLEKLEAQEYDAIILAAAGLKRLGLQGYIKELLKPPLMIPACGQGAIGVECRTDDHELAHILTQLHCVQTERCIQTERKLNALLGGSCHVPIGIFCNTPEKNMLHLHARVSNLTGSQQIEAEEFGDIEQADKLAEQCAQTLFALGAKELIDSVS